MEYHWKDGDPPRELPAILEEARAEAAAGGLRLDDLTDDELVRALLELYRWEMRNLVSLTSARRAYDRTSALRTHVEAWRLARSGGDDGQ